MDIGNEGGDHVYEDVHLRDEDQPSASCDVPSFRLLASDDFLTPPVRV